MKISSNITATMIVANMNKTNRNVNTAMQRLSSGLKINSAKDNPAGLAIAHKLNTQVEGLSQAGSNVMNGISMIQTAEGAMNEVHAMLNRMKELTVQGQNGSYSEVDKQNIQAEMDSLVEEIKSIKGKTAFNNIEMLGSSEEIIIQTGANTSQAMAINGDEINLQQTIEIIDGISFENEEADMAAGKGSMLERIDQAVEKTSEIRGKLGAYQNRLEHTSANLGVSEENTIASLSRIQDTDMAEEMANYTQQNVLTQSGIAMLAQANQRPQQILQLLNS